MAVIYCIIYVFSDVMITQSSKQYFSQIYISTQHLFGLMSPCMLLLHGMSRSLLCKNHLQRTFWWRMLSNCALTRRCRRRVSGATDDWRHLLAARRQRMRPPPPTPPTNNTEHHLFTRLVPFTAARYIPPAPPVTSSRQDRVTSSLPLLRLYKLEN